MTQPESTDEKAMLLASLNQQRKHVLGITEGLSEEDLRRPVLPTGWNCLGMLRHLALDVERFWFQCVAAGDPVEIRTVLSSSESGWRMPADMPSEEVFDLYRREVDRSDAMIAGTDLDAPPAWWPDWWPDWRMQNLRRSE